MTDDRTPGGGRDGEGGPPLYESDLSLAQAAQNGSAPHVDELLDRLRLVPRILRAQNARLGKPMNEAALDDIAQDVFLIIWSKLDAYDGARPFEAWAYRICRYELMNGIRRQHRHAMAEVHPDVPEGEARATPWDYEEVHLGLETLPRTEASVVRLKHFEELTFEQIGARLAISGNTAKTRYYRGLARLEEFLGERQRLDGTGDSLAGSGRGLGA